MRFKSSARKSFLRLPIIVSMSPTRLSQLSRWLLLCLGHLEVGECPTKKRTAKGVATKPIPSLYILWFFAMRPRIVCPKENYPLAYWRVIEVPPTNKGGRSWIGKTAFCIFLESSCCNFAGIGNDAMDQFQAAAIGFVFAVSAQTINRWGKGNHDQTHNERKDGK
jgi:hypothetical protein